MNPTSQFNQELHFLTVGKICKHLISNLRHDQRTLYDVEDVAVNIARLDDSNQFRTLVPELVEIDGDTYAVGPSIISALRQCSTKKATDFITDYDECVSEIRAKYPDLTDINLEAYASIPDIELYPIIPFNPYEKLTRRNGTIIDLELRGNSNFHDCLFNARNIGRGFSIPGIEQAMLTLRSCNEGIEYTYLHVPRKGSSSEELEKCMYISFVGIMVMIDKAKKIGHAEFAKWFSHCMPGHHIVDQLQLSPISFSQFSTLYAFRIGKAKDLRSLFDISSSYSDRADVGLIGCTKDIRRTYAEHILKYGRFKGIKNELLWMSFVPEKYLPEAEQGLEDFSKAMPQCIAGNTPGLVVHEPHIDIKIHADLFRNITNDIMKKVDRKRRKVFKARTEREWLFMSDGSNILPLIQQLEEEVHNIQV